MYSWTIRSRACTPRAATAHEGAMCAGEQNKFWEMHARLFADAPPRDPAQLVPQLLSYAQAIGIARHEVPGVSRQRQVLKAVTESVGRMEQLGVDSTPTFMLGLTPAAGQPMKIVKVIERRCRSEEFKAAIEGLLQQPRSSKHVRNLRLPGRKGVEAICPSKRALHLPGIIVPQSGHAPAGVIRYRRTK